MYRPRLVDLNAGSDFPWIGVFLLKNILAPFVDKIQAVGRPRS